MFGMSQLGYAILFAYLFFAYLSWDVAKGKGRSGALWGLLTLIFSPLVFIIVLCLAKVETDTARKCPFCAELIKVEAIVCKHCGRDIEQPKPVEE